MSKKIIAVNAGPRMGWNTETLISEASRGAEEAGPGPCSIRRTNRNATRPYSQRNAIRHIISEKSW